MIHLTVKKHDITNSNEKIPSLVTLVLNLFTAYQSQAVVLTKNGKK
jgi:hypothetical protein